MHAASLDHRERKVLKVKSDHRARRETSGQLDRVGHRVRLAPPARKDRAARPAQPVRPVRKVPRVRRVHKAFREMLGHVGRRVRLEPRVHPA